MAEEKLEKIADFLPKYTENVPVNEGNFLFFFKPGKLNSDILGKFSLIAGIRVLGVCFILETISALIDIFNPDTFIDFIISIILCILYLVSAFYTLFCTFNPKPVYVKIAYIVDSILMLVLLSGYLLKSLYKFICFLYPFNDNFLKLKFLIYVLGKGGIIFVYLYLVWSLYCYMIRDGKNSDDDNAPPENEALLNPQIDNKNGEIKEN